MAITKVSALTEITSTVGTEELLINDGGTSKKIQVSNLPDTDTNTNQLTTFTVSATTDTTPTTISHGDDLLFTAGTGITCETTADGTVTISNTVTDTDTTYSTATTSTEGLVKIEDGTAQSTAANAVTTTASRTYGVQLNGTGQAVVNVPWTDTDTNTDTKWDGGTTGLTAATGRTSLGLVIGTDVQAYDSTIVVDADIGVNVQAYDSTIVVDADIGSTVQAYDADTSKTDVAEIRTANIDLLTYTEKYITIGTNGVIDLSLGSVFTHTHGGSMSAFTLSNVPSTGTSGFILILENGGSYPLAWWVGSGSAAIKWPAATPPTLTAAGTDIFTFTTPDSGVTWYGIPSGIGMA